MRELETLLELVKHSPEKTEFMDVIDIIQQYYRYTPTGFVNGTENNNVVNMAGENEGSCKIFSFAQIHKLDEIETLNCFGQYYREDVLTNPAGTDHANIRIFMKYGWKYIKFENDALIAR